MSQGRGPPRRDPRTVNKQQEVFAEPKRGLPKLVQATRWTPVGTNGAGAARIPEDGLECAVRHQIVPNPSG